MNGKQFYLTFIVGMIAGLVGGILANHLLNGGSRICPKGVLP